MPGTWIFSNPLTAAVRVPVNTNADGEIAGDGDTAAGQKSFTFSYTAPSATYDEIVYGGSTNTTAGILETFITYLLGGSYVENGVTRTLIQSTTEQGSAPSVSIIVSPTTVTLAAGNTASAAVNVTVSDGGTYSLSLDGAPDWAIISNNSVFLSPEASVTAGQYSFSVVAVSRGGSASARITANVTSTPEP